MNTPWTQSHFLILAADGQPIAHTGGTGRSREDQLAAAALICRAVTGYNDLLAACERAYPIVEQWFFAGFADCDGEMDLEAIRKAEDAAKTYPLLVRMREALAKAKGE